MHFSEVNDIVWAQKKSSCRSDYRVQLSGSHWKHSQLQLQPSISKLHKRTWS